MFDAHEAHEMSRSIIFKRVKKIKNTTETLSILYNTKENYCDKGVVWDAGLRDGAVSQELYDEAKAYYGPLWNYVTK